MEEKKYILTDETIKHKGYILHRIKAVKDISCFPPVKKGDLGGYVESEENLSHYENCWIFGNAKVYDDAHVYGGAIIQRFAEISGSARISGHSYISDRARVLDRVRILENAHVMDDATVSGYSYISGKVSIYKNAMVSHCSYITERADIGKNANIRYENDILFVGPVGSRGSLITFYKSQDNGIWVSCGCFNGSIENFKKAVKKKHGDNLYGRQYLSLIPYAKKFVGNPDGQKDVSPLITVRCCDAQNERS